VTFAHLLDEPWLGPIDRPGSPGGQTLTEAHEQAVVKPDADADADDPGLGRRRRRLLAASLTWRLDAPNATPCRRLGILGLSSA
jgi:hypothetical protein